MSLGDERQGAVGVAEAEQASAGADSETSGGWGDVRLLADLVPGAEHAGDPVRRRAA
ncbi:hypothetical protein GT039_04835, partial [Streptomyces sp. SID2955]|nr:hypothetical protein [Streptomyces sp. SID2955]